MRDYHLFVSIDPLILKPLQPTESWFVSSSAVQTCSIVLHTSFVGIVRLASGGIAHVAETALSMHCKDEGRRCSTELANPVKWRITNQSVAFIQLVRCCLQSEISAGRLCQDTWTISRDFPVVGTETVNTCKVIKQLRQTHIMSCTDAKHAYQ